MMSLRSCGQASAGYPQALRDRLIEEYLDELNSLRPVDREQFRVDLLRFVLFRLLQVLGAYGLRGRFERNPISCNPFLPHLKMYTLC